MLHPKPVMAAIKLIPQRLGTRPGKLSKALFTRIQNLGDCVAFVPTLNLFRKHFPDCEIHVLAGTKPGEDVFRMCPAVNRILRINWPGPRSREEVLQEIKDIRTEDYDAVFLSTEETGMALKMLLAGVPYRVGFSKIHHMGKTHIERFPFLLSRTLSQPEGMHEAEVNSLLVPSTERPSPTENFKLNPSQDARDKADSLIETHGLAGLPYMVVHAGTAQAVKLWPPESFAVCCDIVARAGISIVCIGTKPEQPVIADVVTRMTQPFVDLAGQTGVQELAALLSRASLFVGNDSGPMHLAAAMGTPLAAIFVASDPVVWGPYAPENKKKVFSLGDADVKPEQVAQGLLDLYAATNKNRTVA